MSLIRLKQNWLSQPQGGAQINADSPLVNGLCFLFSAGSGPVDLVSLKRASTVNAARSAGKYGLSLKASSGKPVAFAKPYTMRTSDGAGAGDFTMVALANPANTATKMALISQDANSNGQAYLIANCNTSYAASAGRIMFGAVIGQPFGVLMDMASQIDGQYHLYAGVRRGAAHEIYRDAELVKSTSGTVGNILTTAGSGGVGVGCLYGYTGYDSTDDNVLAAMWNRALSQAEIASLAANPWQLFAPEETWLWTPDTAASRRRVVLWG